MLVMPTPRLCLLLLPLLLLVVEILCHCASRFVQVILVATDFDRSHTEWSQSWFRKTNLAGAPALPSKEACSQKPEVALELCCHEAGRRTRCLLAARQGVVLVVPVVWKLLKRCNRARIDNSFALTHFCCQTSLSPSRV
jgi:hypothetical protein